MKTLSSMHAALHVGMIALTYSSNFHMPSLFTQIHSNSLKNLYKIQMNSEEIQIN